MRKQFWLVIILIATTTSWLSAQNEIVIIHAQGKVEYLPGGNTSPRTVYPGLSLPTQGKIRCYPNSSAKILYDGNPVPLDANNVYDLGEIKAQAQSQGNRLRTFTGRFWSYLSESFSNSDDQAALEKYHQQHMANAKGGIKGFGEKPYGINLVSAYPSPESPVKQAQIGRDPITLRWSRSGSSAFQLTLRNETGEKVLLEARTRDTVFTVNVSQLDLAPDAFIQWSVQKADSTADVSTTSATQWLQYAPEAWEALLSGDNAEAASGTDDAEKLLMLCFQLEEKGFVFSAESMLEKFVGQHPDNVLVKRYLATFKSRVTPAEPLMTWSPKSQNP